MRKSSERERRGFNGRDVHCNATNAEPCPLEPEVCPASEKRIGYVNDGVATADYSVAPGKDCENEASTQTLQGQREIKKKEHPVCMLCLHPHKRYMSGQGQNTEAQINIR